MREPQRVRNVLFVLFLSFLALSCAAPTSSSEPEVDEHAALEPSADPPESDDTVVDDSESLDVRLEPQEDGRATLDPLRELPEADEALAFQPLLKWGLHPRASDALRRIGVPASRIMQTIGNAAASAGTHARDGFFHGRPYSAATDLSVRGMTLRQIRTLLAHLGSVGFAAWFRRPGHDGWPSSEIAHIHAVYVGCPMKASLRSQVHSWLAGRNGLVSNAHYTFFTWSATTRRGIRILFDRYN